MNFLPEKCPHCDRSYNCWRNFQPYCPTCDNEAGPLKRRIKELEARLKEAEAVCESAASVAMEESVRQTLLCYNIGFKLIKELGAWRAMRNK